MDIKITTQKVKPQKTASQTDTEQISYKWFMCHKRCIRDRRKTIFHFYLQILAYFFANASFNIRSEIYNQCFAMVFKWTGRAHTSPLQPDFGQPSRKFQPLPPTLSKKGISGFLAISTAAYAEMSSELIFPLACVGPEHWENNPSKHKIDLKSAHLHMPLSCMCWKKHPHHPIFSRIAAPSSHTCQEAAAGHTFQFRAEKK